MRIALNDLIGLEDGATFAQTYGISFDQGSEWAQQGVQLALDGRLDEARSILEGLVTLNPRSAGYWYALGCVYQSQELAADAVQAFTQVTARDRSNADAWLRLGILKLQRGDRTGLDALRIVVNDKRAENADLVARAKTILANTKN